MKSLSVVLLLGLVSYQGAFADIYDPNIDDKEFEAAIKPENENPSDSPWDMDQDWPIDSPYYGYTVSPETTFTAI
eukprot:CAMPEP_0176385990 /NCGR_PEP_ID=MMETSP0126-20121128/35577_1 /TAXON_ID=141414 ORGANISM="Strombidinopsis acuminatum, Strain SPMC142" /NCGR_SAMPLE_ID=MMETSP0126 /ASSEMBLY_ACC=CAM_ASM_000229 /LENGTH=74 /DNA_ID=CAMNT_0017752653 /DNA_START=1 /DNA_END=225 /DNA_ORIENTATION=+